MESRAKQTCRRSISPRPWPKYRGRTYRCAPNPAGEAPGSHPESCTNNQRWSRIGDIGCEAIPPGTARCVVEDGLAYCANPSAPAAPVAPRSERAPDDAPRSLGSLVPGLPGPVRGAGRAGAAATLARTVRHLSPL